jgi:ATP-dependent Clp protease ATP-binding subunit ClpA
MTSNAGAQFASQAAIGFGGGITKGEAMLKQVKKTFKPEFINRLSGIVVFNEMDRHMAELILDKKLRLLQEKLTARGVTMTLSSAARDLLLQQGFTRDHGAREMDRVIATQLKPLLSREILYGKLQKGGNVTVDVDNDRIITSYE